MILFRFTGWNKLLVQRHILFLSFWLLLGFCPLFTGGIFLDNVQETLPRKGNSSHSRAYQTCVWFSPVEESPTPGTVSPQCKCCLRKNGTPQVRVARNPARVRRVVPFPGSPQAPVRSSGSPLSIFLRGKFASSPSECKRFPPS